MKLTPLFSALLTACVVSASLDQKIKAKGKKYFGNVLDLNTIDDEAITDILKEEFGSVTPENNWKWQAIQGERGTFNFVASDTIADWATKHDKLIQGHVLVWHSQLPAWVHRIEDPEDLKAVIKGHVATVAGRYKGKVDTWHVVNEVFYENGTFRNTVFYRLLGEEFIDIAFHAAKAADPNAKLYITDYGVETAGPKLEALIALIGRLKERGVPIDGIGTQSHLTAGKLKGYEASLQALGNTGLEVAVTELDIRIIPDPEGPVVDGIQQQAKDYAAVTTACLNVKQCVGITLWGVSDNYSWSPQYEPLLWDSITAPKAAYATVDAALD